MSAKYRLVENPPASRKEGVYSRHVLEIERGWNVTRIPYVVWLQGRRYRLVHAGKMRMIRGR